MWLLTFLLCHQLSESMGKAGTLPSVWEVGVDVRTLEVPTCKCVPTADLTSKGSSQPHALSLNKQCWQTSSWQTS